MAFTTRINGINHSVDVDGDTPLLWVIRDVLGMTGTKFGCGRALCGACTVHMDGNPVRSCTIPIERVGDAAIMTIEGIGETPAGKNVQTALLDANPNPNDDDITNAMSGNICRCGTYLRIRDAIKAAAQSLSSHIQNG